MTSPACPFCARISAGAFEEGAAQAVALPDGFPISPGHTLIVPRRHVADLFDLGEEELNQVLALVVRVKGKLEAAHRPAGFNVGVNVGAAAGQTVPHAHVHVIPRYAGDVDDPRGGVRWVLPKKANYWSPKEGP